MVFLRNKIVIVTGAGFSAPANLPIQDRILKEMTQTQEPDFLRTDENEEGIKFLSAYIKVSLYLLKEYGNNDISELERDYRKLKTDYQADYRVQEVIKYIEDTKVKDAQLRDYNLNRVLEEIIENYVIDDNRFYRGLFAIKERLRKLLAENNLKASLEDIFTEFDKCTEMRNHTVNYTYAELDDLQHAILRLFIYYFSRRVNQHKCIDTDYEAVIEFIKRYRKDVAIITTNWDVLFEKYLENSSIEYDYMFNSSYVIDSTGKLYGGYKNRAGLIPFIKVHGSINWFRCLKCGTVQVADISKCGSFLFDDTNLEKCLKCEQVADETNILMRPEIITPTMIKSINGQLYNNIWQNAAYELQESRRIVFCGYSLPLADFEFRNVLKQNVRKDVDIDVVLSDRDNPDKCHEGYIKDMLPEKRFRDLFPNNKCSFYYNGFGDFFQNNNQSN